MKKLNIFFLILVSLLSSCSNDDEDLGYTQVEAPHWTLSNRHGELESGQIANWKVLDETKNITSTMSVIGSIPQISNTKVSEKDLVAFFSAGECVGVTSPMQLENGTWIYMLNLYKPKDPNYDIVMGYYSAATNSICYWLDCFEYSNDAIIGTLDDPFTVSGRISNYAFEIKTVIRLPLSKFEKVGAGDEMAMFCGNECRGVLVWNPTLEQFEGATGMVKDTEKFVVRYYNASEKRLYTSAEFEESIYSVIIYYNSIDLK